jgi:hypothetical protein
MKKIIVALLLGLALTFTFGPVAMAQMAKEGSHSGMVFFSGTFKMIAMERERVQMNYEATGISKGDDENSPLYNATNHCLGSMHAIKGAFDNDTGFCAYTRPDGDQIFMTYEAKGRLGVTDGGISAKGTMKFVGGTGKFVGIEGTGEFDRHGLRATAPGTFNSFNISKYSFKLP